MCSSIQTHLSRALFLTLVVALVPSTVSAQAQCEAQLTPAEVPAGEAAFQVTAQISEDVGAISTVQPASESGLAMASPEDIPRADLAAGDEAPRPVTMAMEGNSATIWLNSEEAQAGTYEVLLQGEAGSCIAEVSVAAGGGGGN